MSNGETLYTYRYGLPLYWLRLHQQTPFSLQTPTGMQLSTSPLTNNPAIIISSEKLFDGTWTAFDDGELFVVKKNLQYDSITLSTP